MNSTFNIKKDHPSLAGHFPGYPIVPGVVALDYVSRGLINYIDGGYISQFTQVKFLRPILPGMNVEVTYTKKDDCLYQFKCDVDGKSVLSGLVRVELPGSEDG